MNAPGPDDRDRLIDRLADGDLPDADRRALLARLDAEGDSDGWRRCALAFLEAQCWRQALGPLAERAPATAPAVRNSAVVPGASRPRPRLAAWAAGLLAAFALGWLSRGGGASVSVDTTQMLASSNLTNAPALVPVPEAESEPPDDPGPSPDAPDPALDAWQRRGFQVERRQRVVSVGLENGRNVALPVNEVRLKYVGKITY